MSANISPRLEARRDQINNPVDLSQSTCFPNVYEHALGTYRFVDDLSVARP